MSSATVSNTFGSQSGPIPLAQLDTNFLDITGYVNNPYNRNNFALDSGTTNTIALSLNPAPVGYTAGLEVAWRQAFTSTSAVSININSLGAKNVLDPQGNTLGNGQLVAGVAYKAIYNGTAFYAITVPTATFSIAVATQAQMQTATSSLTFVTPSNLRYGPSAAKASGWLDGTATGTITGALGTLYGATAHNSGSGTYNIVFAAAMANTQFAVISTPYHSSLAIPTETTRTTAGFTIVTVSASTVAIRPAGLSFVVYGTNA